MISVWNHYICNLEINEGMKNKVKVALIGMLTSAMGSCSSGGDIVSVGADEFEKDITGHKVQLVDVRTPAEYSEGHIENAVNIDVKHPDFFSQASPQLSRKSKVYVYCRSGRRSMGCGATAVGARLRW